jgi:hypothetical protein
MGTFDPFCDDTNKNSFHTGYATMRRLGRKYRKQGFIASNAQGFASVGGPVVVQYFQNAKPLDVQYGTLVKFNVVTGEEFKSNDIKGYHGNSMAYNSRDGYLYLCPAEDSEGQDTRQRKQVFKIDRDSLSIVDIVDLSNKTKLNPIHSIGYDSVDDCMILCDRNTLEFYDADWNLLFRVSLEDVLGFTPLWMQGIQVNRDILYYIGGRKSQIWAMKMDFESRTVQYKTTYTFDMWQENLYSTGEIEGLGFNHITGEIYVVSHITVGNWGGFTQYFVTNQNFQVAFSSSPIVTIQNPNANPVNLYYGSNDNYNPDGSQSNPFSSLLEAVIAMRSPYTAYYNLQITEDSDETLVLANVNNARITFNGNCVRAVVMINSHNLCFAEIITNGISSYHKDAVYSCHSSFRAENVTCRNIHTESDIGYGLFLEQSHAFIASTSTSVYAKKSIVESPQILLNFSKDGKCSILHGSKKVACISSMADVVNLTPDDYPLYNYIQVIIDINLNGSRIIFDMKSKATDMADFIGYRIHADVLYMCVFHLEKGDPDHSAVALYDLSEGRKKETMIHSWRIEAALTDD